MAGNRSEKRYWKGMILAGAVLAVVVVLLLSVFGVFRVREVTITGNEYYTKEQVADFIVGEGLQRNTLYLYIRYNYMEHPEIPFIDTFEVKIDSPSSITIRVYEKNIVGYVQYLGKNVYFDKDGIVLDSSKRRVGSAPLIKGLTFTEWSIGKKLPSDDDKKFQTILTITQLVEKYDLEIDGIKFTAENEIVLQHGGITIELGEGEYLAVQMMNLGNILKNLEGMSGTLYMKDFDSENATASFSKN